MLRQIDFYNEVIHGESFALGSPVSYLHGNVGDKVKVVSQILTFTRATSDDVDVFTYSAGRLDRVSGSFLDDGFFPNQEIQIKEIDGGGQQQFATIDFVDDLYIEFTVVSGTFGGGDYPTATNGTMQLTVQDDINAIVYRHGVIENNETTNFVSKYNDKVNEWRGVGLTVGGIVSCVAKSGTNKDGSVSARYISNTLGENLIEITHIFKIPPFYLDEFASNLTSNTIPSLLIAQNSLKYVFEVELRFDSNNPNNVLVDGFDRYKGSVGWYGEETNSNTPDFTIDSVSYADGNGDSIESIKADTTSVVTINLTGVFNSTTAIRANIATAKGADIYKQSNSDFDDTFLYDSIGVVGATSQAGSNIIKQVSVVHTSGTEAVVTVKVEYTSNQRATIDFANDEWLLSLSIADQSLSLTNTNKCLLLVGYEAYQYNSDIPGLLTWNSVEVFAHNDTSNGKTSYNGWPKDGVRIEWEAELSGLITGLKYSVVAKSATNMFTINEYEASLGNPPVSLSGVQYFNINTNRGFNLNASDPFNVISLETIDDSPFTVSGVAGIKLGWQDWIKNEAVDTAFVDITKPNNNLNKLSSNYEALGYKLYIAITAEVSQNGVPTEYAKLIELDSLPYGEDNNPTPEWECTTEITDIDENVTGVIDSNGFSYILATFTPEGGDTSIYADLEAIIRIEKQGQSGEGIHELSSLRSTYDSNPLKPLIGLSNAEITDTGSVVEVRCRVDGRMLEAGATYVISSRLFNGYANDLTPDFSFDAVTYLGGGEFEIPVTAKDYAAAPLPSGKTVTIGVEYDSAVAETLTGLTGQDISTFTTDHPVPSNSFVNFASVAVSDGNDISFDKLSWATQNNLLNGDAVAITLRSKAYDRGFDSTEDTEIIPIQTVAGKGHPQDIDYLTSSLLVFADNTKGVRTFVSEGYTELLGTLANAKTVSVDRGLNIVYATNAGVSVYKWDSTNRADLGGSGTPTTELTQSFNITSVYANNAKTNSGYADVWVTGTSKVILRYRNAGAWSTVDFTSLVASISATVVCQSLVAVGNDVYVLGNEPASGSRIFKLSKTGGGSYYDVSQWAASSIIGNNGIGSNDGLTGAAKFSGDCRKIVLFGWDDNISATSGTNPNFLISDYGNNIYRHLRNSSGFRIDTYSLYCGTTGTNSYSFPGSGLDIQVGSVAGMVLASSTLFYGTGDGTPDRVIFKITDITNALQDGDVIFEGTTGYQEQVTF